MDWLGLLRKAVLSEGSQAAVATRIGYSPAAISQVLSDTYPGSTDTIRDKILTIYGGKTMQQSIPEGYMQNAVGHLVPIEQIDEIDLLRDDFVGKAVQRAMGVSETLAAYKQQLSGDMQSFLDLSSEKYKVKSGGVKGNVTLVSFDGKYKIIREIAERLDFDERLQSAKALIDECLREWTKYTGSEVRTLIEDAFQVDVKGRINTKRILSLRKLKIEHPTWQQAMIAIGEAVTVTGSCTYYRIYERDDSGKYHQLNLDFSGV